MKNKNKEEMTYVEGGAQSRKLTMSRDYLKKTFCEVVAKSVLRSQKQSGEPWNNITADQLMKEIYAHAYIYYKWSVLEKIPILSNKIYKPTTNGIDIENGVDSRQWAFELIWNL